MPSRKGASIAAYSWVGLVLRVCAGCLFLLLSISGFCGVLVRALKKVESGHNLLGLGD